MMIRSNAPGECVMTELTTDEPGDERYLIFWVGSERFAAPLLSIREIVEALPCRAVPNTPISFLGLINLRGQIVGLVDLGICFGLSPVCEESNGILLVFDTDGAAVAGLVSNVEAVIRIPTSAITKDRLAPSAIPESAFLGTADASGHLIPVVNLKGIIQQDTLVPSEQPLAG
jgi:purine-binding chemotaxis protein CheW